MDQPTQQHFTVTGKVWRVVKDNKLSLLYQVRCAHSFSKSVKEVFDV